MPRWNNGRRIERRHRIGRADQRKEFQRDHDRVLYSSAFKRLSGVTQIVRANEADIFHNRLSHTLKVAQISRRIAEHLCSSNPDGATELGVDADVAAAAGLIHDLGHPPFGHLGEQTLHAKVLSYQDQDGFEGNAQSFRIVTHLSSRFLEIYGLDLTRATLRAAVKYPWFRNPSDPDKSKKWGAYQVDQQDFEFAMSESSYETKSAEAAIMDWADDIAYSVHDVEDMHRARLIPWYAVDTHDGKETLVDASLESWHKAPVDAAGRLREAYDRIMDELKALVPGLLQEPYDGRLTHRQQLRFWTSRLIGRYVTSTELDINDPSGVSISDPLSDEVRLLKQIARSYLIRNPALAAQQHGQRIILERLFDDLMSDRKNEIVPVRFLYLFKDGEQERVRAVADLLSGLTESEAMGFYGRLHGHEAGSVLDPIVW